MTAEQVNTHDNYDYNPKTHTFGSFATSTDVIFRDVAVARIDPSGKVASLNRIHRGMAQSRDFESPSFAKAIVEVENNGLFYVLLEDDENCTDNRSNKKGLNRPLATVAARFDGKGGFVRENIESNDDRGPWHINYNLAIPLGEGKVLLTGINKVASAYGVRVRHGLLTMK